MRKLLSEQGQLKRQIRTFRDSDAYLDEIILTNDDIMSKLEEEEEDSISKDEQLEQVNDVRNKSDEVGNKDENIL